MFSKYYQAELSYLREIGKSFGLANPAAAGMLAERSGDPDVERLIEGFAFLTARIREKIDDSVPEVIQQLADLVFPHVMRPVPAASIVEFTPNMAAMRERLVIPRGTEITATKLATPCKFQTTQDVEIVPAKITDVILDRSSKNRPVLNLQLGVAEGGGASLAMPKKALRLFLQGELALTATIRLWLLRYCTSIVIRGESGAEVELGRQAIRSVGFSPSEALLPWPDFAPQGLQFLQEYFLLPEKFLFLDLFDLEKAAGLIGERFEIAFRMDHPPDLPGELQATSVRLHCAPVVNIFETTAEPIRLTTFSREKVVRAAGLDPDHMEIYSVDEVIGLRPGRRERRVYNRFFDFTHAAPGSTEGYYQISHRQSLLNDGLDVYLAVNSPRDRAPDTGDETLSLQVSCTNRSLPSELRVGDICQPSSTVPAIVTVRNISAVTTPVRPPIGDELQWRMVSHLAMNYSSLATTRTLTAMCHLYNFQAAADHSAGYTNRMRIDGIRRVDSESARRIMHHAAVRGVATKVELDASSYASLGEAELFGSILSEIFAARVAINSFHELSINVQPFNIDYTWPARNGQLAIS